MSVTDVVHQLLKDGFILLASATTVEGIFAPNVIKTAKLLSLLASFGTGISVFIPSAIFTGLF